MALSGQPGRSDQPKIYEKGGFVSSVYHAAVGLLNSTLSNGSVLVKDKKVTGFSNEEEKLVELISLFRS